MGKKYRIREKKLETKTFLSLLKETRIKNKKFGTVPISGYDILKSDLDPVTTD